MLPEPGVLCSWLLMFRSLKYFLLQNIPSEHIIRDLTQFGYTRSKAVAEAGQFAVRGGIIDIFPVNFDAPVRIDMDDEKVRRIYTFNILSGKNIWEHRAVIILPAKERGKASFRSEMPLNNFVDIEKGDYVVHNIHGIGRFLGVEDIAIDQKDLEHFVIEYEGGDKLFVPRHDLHLVQKYIGFSKRPPRLFKLGSREW